MQESPDLLDDLVLPEDRSQFGDYTAHLMARISATVRQPNPGMVFTDLPFIVFLPLFCLAYFATRGRVRLIVSLLGSYLFYGWWDWRFLGLIMVSTLINYYAALRIDGTSNQLHRWRWLTFSVVVNLLILGTFKYFDFFADSFVHVAHWLGLPASPIDLNIILPVGISFFTFQTMSYTIDVYRHRVDVEPSFLRLATFVAFFPQLVAGPIVRASTFLPQLREDHPFCWTRMASGSLCVLWGYVLKVVIADSLSHVVDLRFGSPSIHNSASLAIGVLFYAFQIYCDFNGYSLIATGLAHAFGYDFGVNFNRPYFATNFSDFWQRWHISLSTWLRDYLYIPLGGNRCGSLRTYLNLMLTMLLGGLWHGADWRFVVWGGLHGSYLVVQRFGAELGDRYFPRAVPTTLTRALSLGTVFLLTCVAWVFFRAASMADAVAILRGIFIERDFQLVEVAQKFYIVKGAILIAALVFLEALSLRVSAAVVFARLPWLVPVSMACMLWVIAFLGTFGQQTFIYFQF